MIKRDNYLNILKATINNDFVKILVGVRRSGKTTILDMLKDYLLTERNISPAHIIGVNYEDVRNSHLQNGEVLQAYVEGLLRDEQKYYLFIDEVQEIEEWAKYINSIRVAYNIDIYVSGSNAKLFAGDHLTYLSGRYLKFDVYPLSFAEFINFNNSPTLLFSQNYNEFLKGSLPAYVLEKNQIIKNVINQDVFDSIVTKDLISSDNIGNETALKAVIRYIAQHISNTLSVNKIVNSLISGGTKISYNSVALYVQKLLGSKIILEVPRYDIKGKEILKTLNKYYIVDFGLRNIVVPASNRDLSHTFENFVYLELIKKGYQVFVGKLGRDFEIDFVAIKDETPLYIQVCLSLVSPETLRREERPFLHLNENHKKIIVTFDYFNVKSDYYEVLNIEEFLARY